MNLTLNEYQERAWSTAVYDNKGNNLEYISLGLGGETGEVQEYFKKTLHRGQSIPVDHLEKELGDVLWYLAGGASECRFSLSDIVITLKRTMSKDDLDTFIGFQNHISSYFYGRDLSLGALAVTLNQHISKLQQELYTFQYGYKTPYIHIFHCLEYLSRICTKCNLSMEHVALLNLEKLASRKERGVLKGEGDNR